MFRFITNLACGVFVASGKKEVGQFKENGLWMVRICHALYGFSLFSCNLGPIGVAYIYRGIKKEGVGVLSGVG